MAFCPACGRPCAPDARFCAHCGAQLLGAEGTSSPDGIQPPKPIPPKARTGSRNVVLGVVGVLVIGAVFLAVLPGIGAGGPTGAGMSGNSAAPPTPDTQQAVSQAYAALDATDQQVVSHITGAVQNQKVAGALYQQADSGGGRRSDLFDQQSQAFATERALLSALGNDGIYDASSRLACSVDLANNTVVLQMNLGAQLADRIVNGGSMGGAAVFLQRSDAFSTAAATRLQGALLGRQYGPINQQLAQQAPVGLQHCSS